GRRNPWRLCPAACKISHTRPSKRSAREALMRRFWIILANTLLLPCTLHGQADLTAWIRSNAVPLKTVEARHGFDDMEPLRRIIGDARIVSLGTERHARH